MFSIFKTESSKLREAAKNWLYHAGKVYHFRKDRLSASELSTLLQLSEEVKSRMKDKADDSRLRSSMEALKGHMELVGGNYYPRGSMAENVEFFFAALIIYVGFTTFFIKPFKIPTNSMWPTYYGMTGEVYGDESEAPNAMAKVFRFISYGAKHYNVEAPASGELLIPMVEVSKDVYQIYEKPAHVKRYFLINSPGIERSFFVGNESVSFKYPADFVLDREVIDPLQEAGEDTPYGKVPYRVRITTPGSFAGTASDVVYDARSKRQVNVELHLLRTGKMVEDGESLLSFDLMTGDQLFVDRMSYHFVSPKVGDGFVFKTDSIPGVAEDKFYIKRLVGTAGDKVSIDGTTMMVNGEPATGSVAFEKNSKQEGKYRGYTTMEGSRITVDLSEEQTVPDGHFFAIGDNSFNSSDGRVWGYVPSEAVVGRPIVIYYPFTSRFGLAK